MKTALRLLTVGLIVCLTGALLWSLGELERRDRLLAERDRSVRAYQMSVEAIAASLPISPSALEPHLAPHRLGAPNRSADGGELWVIQPDDRPTYLTDFPEVSVEFREGRLLGVYPYKP
ncbi:MAG: hypothetical protein H6741_29240 [Alphaproteobacteria bacterium]|nr:hypothetical protein [Alphaproteobacteria bacterium]MCB9796805.1 hypothetical protein [Alphaproteobacteria bacterium]